MKRILLALIVSIPFFSHAQQVSLLKGKVLTSDGKAAEGVSVTLKGLKTGASTDEEGAYEIKIFLMVPIHYEQQQ
jgi:iron complex outermembrane recepter protein